MCCGFVFRSIVHETTKVLDQAVVTIFSFTNQQEIDVSIRLDVPRLVQRIHLVGFVVAKYIDAQIV